MSTYSTAKCGYCLREHSGLEAVDGEVTCPMTNESASVGGVTLNMNRMYVVIGGAGKWHKDAEKQL